MNHSLIQKGLRLCRQVVPMGPVQFESFPDSEGIKTPVEAEQLHLCRLNHSLIQKGLRRLANQTPSNYSVV